MLYYFGFLNVQVDKLQQLLLQCGVSDENIYQAHFYFLQIIITIKRSYFNFSFS